MQLENNLYRENIDYTQPYLTDLTGDEKKVCEGALQDVEDAIAGISKLQSRRKDRSETIETPLRLDELQEIDLAIKDLNKSLAILRLSIKANNWSKQSRELTASLYIEKFLGQEVTNE